MSWSLGAAAQDMASWSVSIELGCNSIEMIDVSQIVVS